MNKNKILIWAVILLVVLNLTTVATILYHNYQERNDNEIIVVGEEGQNALNGRFFRHVVGFDYDQMEVFRSAKQELQPRASVIISRIDSLKLELFRELNSAKVDTTHLNSISDEIGSLHADLKKETNRFYLKIKTVCTPGQFAKVQQAFTPLFRTEPCDGRGLKGRHGRGHGNGFRNQQ